LILSLSLSLESFPKINSNTVMYTFLFFFEMGGSLYVAQAGLELLGSSHPPASDSQVVGIACFTCNVLKRAFFLCISRNILFSILPKFPRTVHSFLILVLKFLKI
jgi:hypothetical protein